MTTTHCDTSTSVKRNTGKLVDSGCKVPSDYLIASDGYVTHRHMSQYLRRIG